MKDAEIRALIAESEARCDQKIISMLAAMQHFEATHLGTVSAAEARATLLAAPAEAEPEFGRLYQFPGAVGMISAGTRELQILADVREMDWADRALCTEVDIGDLFFVEKGGSTLPAKRVCAGCPVTAECLAYALERGEEFGVWGGLSARERRDIARARRREAA